MRILLLFLILWPFILQAQSHDNWLTPFATIEFEKDKVVYRYMGNNPICALEPQFLIPDLIIPVPESNPTNMGCKAIMEEMDLFHQYLLDPNHPTNDKTDQLRYLKAFALQTVLALGRYELPSESLFEKVHQLAINPDQEMANRAKLVAKLYQRVEETLKEKRANINYIHESASSGLFPAMFSCERIVSPNALRDMAPSDSVVWPKYYGEPNRKDYSYGIIETYDHGYIMCGGYFNDESTWSWLIKIDANGDTLWEKILECGGFNYLLAINQTMDGGVIACGAIQYNKSDQMPYIIKINACGQKEWCKGFYTSEPLVLPWAQDIKETNNGDYIVLINTFGDYPEETMHLFRLNTNGDLLWKKAFCSGYFHPEGTLPLGNKLFITSDNNYLISGDVYWEDPWNPGGPKPIRPMLVMVDSNGIEQWVLPFGLSDTIHGTAKMAIEPKGNGIFVATGSDWGNSQVKPFFMKFDQIGNELDSHSEDPKNFCTEIFEGAFTRIINKEEKYYLSGLSEFEPGDIFGIFEASIDTSIFSLPMQLHDSIILLEEQGPHDLISTMNNKLMSSSTFKESGNWDIALSKLNLNLEYDTLDPGNYTYDSLCTTPGLPQSGFIFLDDCDIITGVDIPSPEAYYAGLRVIPITAFPNPAKDKVTFGIENTQYHKHITLRCFNLLGKQVFETAILTGQKEAATDVSRWPQGMYLAVVYSEGLPAGECKFVVQ
ncbi:MAG: T9SS type A sorting domain-containing protein [Bacteroidetes bacterium]|nr:T9SS type A sorting domain-containing protein [Bacteroidota bacterium]